MAESTVSMKLLIDTKGKRVLFAEAGKDCVDFLFQILSLPAATIIRLLQAQGMVGSLPKLYQSLENLSDAYILPDQSKDTFLKPVSGASIPLLALNDAKTPRNKFYRCANTCLGHVSDDPRAVCPSSRQAMTTNVVYVAPPAASEHGGIVMGVITYMVMDDLAVKPMSTISSIAMLNKYEVGTLEEKVVALGMNEALKLLKASLHTNKVLSHVFC